MLGTSFKTNPIPLNMLLNDVHAGRIQLPDFQRSWVWDDDRIRSLLASISVGFPIGAVMTLETGGEASFLTRPIEGASSDPDSAPDTLLLDGQQRLTSLYQALMTDDPVRTKDPRGKIIERHYYIDMEKSLSDEVERDEWIVSVPADRVVRKLRDITLDLSTVQREYELGIFPLNQVFSPLQWQNEFYQYWEFDPTHTKQYIEFHTTVISRFQQYQLPVITLGRGTSKEAVCLVFEKVNTGGVTLDVFELLTASLAADGFQLRADWEAREERLETAYPVLGDLQSTEFLQVVSLLATLSSGAVGCRRRDILRTSIDDYKHFAPLAEAGFEAAAKFLNGEMILQSRDVPYRSQIVPLAAILADLGVLAQSITAMSKLRRWFWNGVLGETYGGSTETIFARDLPEVRGWIAGGDQEPSTITNANFQASRLRTLRSRNSAAYKGIHALLMKSGCFDFLSGTSVQAATFFDEQIDIHHIFPQKWCKDSGIAPSDFNSIINKTALSARTNRRLGGRAPSVYLKSIREEAGSTERAASVIGSHCISERLLSSDDFWGFSRDRGLQLLALVQDAMGKDVTLDDPDFASPDAEVEEFDDGPIDWAAEAAS